MDMIYIILIIGWAGMGLGFSIKDYAITVISSILLTIWGLYILLNGMVGIQDWFTEAISIIHIFTGLYVFLRASYEMYKEM